MKRSAADHVLKNYAPFINSTQHELLYVGSKMPVPKFDPETILEIVESATKILQAQGPLIEIQPPVCIVGDIHGNLRDLLRIISLYFTETDYKFLFLGDYVDRGPFSLEVVTLLYSFLIKYPRRFFMIRGNHEVFDSNSSKSIGLIDDCNLTYQSTKLVDPIYRSFGWLPIAALINEKILCLHGGLSPDLHTLDDIKSIKIPFNRLNTELVSDILWSDPNRLIAQFMDSARGRGKYFGASVANKFLRANNLTHLIRGHQCVTHGVEFFSENVITVFSSSYYNDEEENKAGVLLINENMEIVPVSLPAYQQTKRFLASFVDAPNIVLTRGTSEVYNGSAAALTHLPAFPTFGHITPKKRRNSGLVSLRTVPVSASPTRPVKKYLPIARLPSHL